MAMCTPIARSALRVAAVRPMSSIIALSVTSSDSRPGAMPWRAMAAATVCSSLVSANWRLATLTATGSGPLACGAQAAIWRQASSMAQAPTGTIRPLRSSSGMNSAGDTTPWPGRFQRSKASAPTMRPVPICTLGW